MHYRRLGRSGLQVSAVGLGCNNFGSRLDADATARVVHAALDCGITLLDTADVYGSGTSEEFIGCALQGRRHRAFIATKFGNAMGEGPYERGASRHYIYRAVEASLRRLRTDYIDLYQLHIPDAETPIEETLSALDDLVRGGKVRYIGSSNFAAWQIADADWTARENHLTPFVSAQNAYSLLNRGLEKEVVPACRRFDIGILPYHPLAAGMLTGKYRRNEPLPKGTKFAINERARERFLTEDNFAKVDALNAFAETRDISLLNVAIAGLAAQPQVASVIAGATVPEQVEANARSLEWTPTSQDLQEIDRITG